MKSHAEWRGSKNSINVASSRGKVRAYVYIHARVPFFSASVYRPLSVNCIASIKSLGERKRPKAQFSGIAVPEAYRRANWLTDWSIDSVPSARIGPHNRPSICRQFMQKSTFEFSSFFSPGCTSPRGKKNKIPVKTKGRTQFSRPLVILVWNFIFNMAYKLAPHGIMRLEWIKFSCRVLCVNCGWFFFRWKYRNIASKTNN